MSKQKLELTWIGKEKRPKLEPRILLEESGRSYHAKQRVSDNDIFDNRLIFGDNLLALKALEADFAGRVKCVFIDPPYNTGSAFTHYDDGLEHSIWLGLMRDRLEIIHRLLADDGSLWSSLIYRFLKSMFASMTVSRARSVSVRYNPAFFRPLDARFRRFSRPSMAFSATFPVFRRNFPARVDRQSSAG